MKLALAALVALASILFAAYRIWEKYNSFSREIEVENLFFESRKTADDNNKIRPDEHLKEARARLAEEVLRGAMENPYIDREISQGLRCWWCKGPHPYRWCAAHPENKDLKIFIEDDSLAEP